MMMTRMMMTMMMMMMTTTTTTTVMMMIVDVCVCRIPFLENFSPHCQFVIRFTYKA